MKPFLKLYHLFLVAAVLLVMLSGVPVGNSLDMPVPGASYRLSYSNTLRGIAMLMLLLWLLYMTTKRILFSVALTRIHIIATLLMMAVIVYFFFHFSGHQNSSEGISFQTRLTPQTSVPLLIMLFLFAQLIFIFNLVAGIVRRVNK